MKPHTINRSAALRAQRRNKEDAERIVSHYTSTKARPQATNVPYSHDLLKLTFLGGLDGVGEKNMAILEWQNDALVLDCGNNLGVDLPGVNYEICDPSYLQSIRHKVRAYVISHGHLDHMGGLRHIVPQVPAPIYGSPFTLGVVAKSFADAASETGQDFAPKLIPMQIDNHERLKIGSFFVELIRVTHSIPEPTAVCIDTPVGRVIATGDFRLDPEPLDNLPTDTNRLAELGSQGVLLLLSESSYANSEGRTPPEHTLQQSFYDVIEQSPGRIFVTVFSSNINRIQMVINAAVRAGRTVALDGRSMLGFSEIAVRQGILKIPKGMVLPMQQTASVADDKLLIMSTGGQGEPGAALQRMSEGEHKYIKLKSGDTVVISSTPIPGNEIRYDQLSNNLARKGVHLFRHPTHELDGCGPLHVSGHARREEMREMLQLTKPRFFIPVHAGALRRRYHADIALQEGWSRSSILLPNNGESVLLSADTMKIGPTVSYGSLLVDSNGNLVSNVVVKDRLLLANEGIIAVVLTVDKATGRLLTSPDIISRGFINMRDNEALMNDFRSELRRATEQRFKRIDLDRFKAELRDHMTQFLFDSTGRSPLVIPVVNLVGSTKSVKTSGKSKAAGVTEQLAEKEHARFQQMRARLLGQDQIN